MGIKKSELYSSLWASCDALRGGMDASQYKDYVLVLLFVKYVSDKYYGDPNALIVIPEGGSFKDMVARVPSRENLSNDQNSTRSNWRLRASSNICINFVRLELLPLS